MLPASGVPQGTVLGLLLFVGTVGQVMSEIVAQIKWTSVPATTVAASVHLMPVLLLLAGQQLLQYDDQRQHQRDLEEVEDNRFYISTYTKPQELLMLRIIIKVLKGVIMFLSLA